LTPSIKLDEIAYIGMGHTRETSRGVIQLVNKVDGYINDEEKVKFEI